MSTRVLASRSLLTAVGVTLVSLATTCVYAQGTTTPRPVRAITPSRAKSTPATARTASTAPVAAWTGNHNQEFSLTAKSFNEKQSPTGTVLTVTGEVLITSLETKLRSDAAVFNRTTQQATTPGKIQFDDVQNSLFGATGSADYRTQQALFNGDVKVMVRSSPEGGATPTELGTLTCDKLTYNWHDRQAVATGTVTLKLKDRTVTADKATYDGHTEKFALSGNVRIVSAAGDTLTAPKATLMLKQGAEEMSLDEGTTSVLKIQDGGTAASATPAAVASAQ